LDTPNNEKITSDNQTERQTISKLLFNAKFIFGAILMYTGVGIPLLLKTTPDITTLFEKYGPTVIGGLSALVGVALAFGEMEKIKRLRREEKFIDVDESRKIDNDKIQKIILAEIATIKNITTAPSEQTIEELVSKIVTAKYADENNIFDSFENYFNDIRRVLLEQAHTSDKKASILLDKGTAYSKGGITFFITSIIAWQILSWLTEFKEQYIYGIISCSLLFIFIEFLAAWFLKQYRHFVDTSTYHIKVKSIFDKYMMSFLAIKTLSNNTNDTEIKYQTMLKILEKDIQWPESYLLKNADVSFAKEALETMTHLVSSLKSEIKDKKD